MCCGLVVRWLVTCLGWQYPRFLQEGPGLCHTASPKQTNNTEKELGDVSKRKGERLKQRLFVNAWEENVDPPEKRKEAVDKRKTVSRAHLLDSFLLLLLFCTKHAGHCVSFTVCCYAKQEAYWISFKSLSTPWKHVGFCFFFLKVQVWIW